MAACPKWRPQTRKRQHAEAELSYQELPSQPSKRLKPTRKRHIAPNFPAAFYDSLSKVSLTRRALRELDRRNQLKGSACARAPAHIPIRQSSNQKDLQRFARLGGPEVGDLRGCPEPTVANLQHTMTSNFKCSSHSSRASQSRQIRSPRLTSKSTSKTRNTESSRRRSSAYNEDFEQHLVDHGIYMNNRKSRPSNANEIRERLAQPRPSLSPARFPESAFEEFQQRNEDVIKEGDVMREVLPKIYGNADILHQEDLLFTRLESITNEATVDAKPDFYDGAPLGIIDKQVREDLGPYIIPTGHIKAPAAPNFFVEAKAPSGGADVAKRQITHDLCLGARAMHKLQSYAADRPVFDNNAYTLGATYLDGNLKMYATHVALSGPVGSLEYHMTQLGGWDITGDPDTYRRGAAALRHGREISMEYRNQFISAANERARCVEPPGLESSTNNVLNSTDAYRLEESRTSADVPAADSFLYGVTDGGNNPSNQLLSEYHTSFSQNDDEDDVPTPSFSHSMLENSAEEFLTLESDRNNLSNIPEELETTTDELAMAAHTNSAPSKKRPARKKEKTVSKASRQSIDRLGEKRRPKR